MTFHRSSAYLGAIVGDRNGMARTTADGANAKSAQLWNRLRYKLILKFPKPQQITTKEFNFPWMTGRSIRPSRMSKNGKAKQNHSSGVCFGMSLLYNLKRKYIHDILHQLVERSNQNDICNL